MEPPDQRRDNVAVLAVVVLIPYRLVGTPTGSLSCADVETPILIPRSFVAGLVCGLEGP